MLKRLIRVHGVFFLTIIYKAKRGPGHVLGTKAF